MVPRQCSSLYSAGAQFCAVVLCEVKISSHDLVIQSTARSRDRSGSLFCVDTATVFSAGHQFSAVKISCHDLVLQGTARSRDSSGSHFCAGVVVWHSIARTRVHDCHETMACNNAHR